MITVHYKPLDALRPVHIAVMAATEAGLLPIELPAIFGLPELVLQHARDDLVGWGLARPSNGRVGLLPGGSRCVSVWVATEQRGHWSFPDLEGWPLGKGVFFFRTPLSRLSDAGFHPETGSALSQKEAMDKQRAFFYEVEQLEKELKIETVSRSLKSCLLSGGDPGEMITTWLGRPKSRLHFNHLCRQMTAALDDCHSNDTATQQWIRHARRCIDDLRQQAEYRLRDEQRSMQPVQEVLIAKWLSERTGVLRELAESDPCSLLIRSDSESVETATQARDDRPKMSHNRPGSIMDGLKDLFCRFFK